MCGASDRLPLGPATPPITPSISTHDLEHEQSFFPVNPGEYDEKRPRFVPLSTQVAGHDGVLSDENGFVIIKPCTDQEINFYEKCLADESALLDCIPAFMGTLELNTPETLASMAPEVAAAIPEDLAKIALDPAYSPPNAAYERAVVLENLAFGYLKPCILDLKLGFQLCDDDATPEKRARLDAVSSKTTSGSIGARVAGMKVWKAQENRYKEYERNWGKTLTPETISVLGIHEFFNARIRRDQKELIASRFLRDIENIIKTLDDAELRIYSPSLLFVYEGDQGALDVAIEEEGKQMIRDELGDGFTSSLDRTVEEDVDSVDGSSSDADLAQDFCICRMIDFAHAKFTPGRGPDENILRALRSARRLILDFLDSRVIRNSC